MRVALKYIFLSVIWFMPSFALAQASFGEAAENLLGPTELLTKLFLLACYIVGIMLIFTAFVQYRLHRQNPKQVPLTTPVTLLILGVICALIPYGSKMFGITYSAVEQKGASDPKAENLLPLPDLEKRGPLLPLPQRKQQELERGGDEAFSSKERREEVYPQDPPSRPRGNWTTDPRYN